MYSLVPKVKGPESRSSGSSRQQIDAYSISIAEDIPLTPPGSASSTANIIAKSGLISRVFGAKSKGSASSEIDKGKYDDFFSAPNGQIPLIGPAPYLQPLKQKLVARAEPSCLSGSLIGREPGPVPLATITFWPQNPKNSNMEETRRMRESPLARQTPEPLILDHHKIISSTTIPGQCLKDRIDRVLRRQAKDISREFGTNEETFNSWKEYIENYSAVRFSGFISP